MNSVLNAQSRTFPGRGNESQKVYDLAIQGWEYFFEISEIQAMYPKLADAIHDQVHHGKLIKF